MRKNRHLVHFGLQLAIEMHDLVQSAHTSTVLQCMVHLVDFYMVISAPTFSASLAKQACLEFCTLYSALSREATSLGLKMWVMKPKIHMFQDSYVLIPAIKQHIKQHIAS